MTMNHIVRLSLATMAAVAGLVSAGSASAQIQFPGKDCEVIAGRNERIVGTKLCNFDRVFMRIRCVHEGPAQDITTIKFSADDNSTDNAIACGIEGFNGDAVTYPFQSLDTGAEATGEISKTTRNRGPNSTTKVVVECVIPGVDQGPSCFNFWSSEVRR
jgi:hypothetical protein